jgi:hypothetical protein
MKNKTAIRVLEQIEHYLITHTNESCEEEHTAIALAINALEEPEHGKFECRIKIKDLISMLLEFDMNDKATICTTDEYNGNNIVISITDMRGKEE